jgi:predicted PurR-regulated permease PerM
VNEAAPAPDGEQTARVDAPVAERRRVHPLVELLAAYGWRLLVLAAVALGLLWLVGQLWVLLVALAIGTFLARALTPVNDRLTALGLKPALAALVSLLVFVGVVSLVGWLVAPRVAEQFDSLGPTLSEAADDLERWLVEDSRFDVSQADVDRFREDLGDAVSNAFESSGDTILSGALLAVEAFTGFLLALVTTFFFLKDGPRLQRFVLARVAPDRRDEVRRLARRAWSTIGGYLKGAALLGLLEAAIIGVAMTVVGAELALPVAVLTFAAAFVPIVGAVVAGVLAVLVTLATAGLGPALVVGGVALAVQQLDNDLLAPVIYGKALSLHPLAILFAVVAGGALFGFGGSVLAVPLVAVVANVGDEAGLLRARDDADDDPADDPDEDDP